MLKFLLSFFRKKRAPLISSTKPKLSWSEILPQPKIYPPKEQRIMLLPDGKALLWKTENEKKKGNDGISLQFEFQHGEKSAQITMKRHFDQKLVESLSKLRSIIVKKLGKDQSGENILKTDKKFLITFNVETNTMSTMTDLYNNLNASELYILDKKFEIIRKRPPGSDFGLTMTPLTNSIVMAKFDSCEPSPRYHWFVHNIVGGNPGKPKKKTQNNLDFKFLDEKSRTFSIEGYEFRSTGRFFKADPSDIGRLVAVVFDAGCDLPVNGSISTQVIEEGPIELVTDSQKEWCMRTKSPENGIRVMTYNILADLYLKLNVDESDLFFKYCDRTYQRALYRVPLILRQFKDFMDTGVELFFIQEIDISKVFKYYIPFFAHYNYKMEFEKKRRMVNEGVAIAFDVNRFRVVKSTSYGLCELVNSSENSDVLEVLETSEETRDKFLSRPTIVQIVILEDLKVENTWIVCANTHLHHNPTEEHIKLLQAVIAVRQISRIKEEILNDETSPKNIRILFGGDFNSIPGGPVYEFMTTGKIGPSNSCWTLDPVIRGCGFEFPENLKLTCLTGTPRYTNYTHTDEHPGFIGCLDYIWGEEIWCQSMCPMPDHSKIIEYGAIPSKTSPSDHIPLISDLKYGSI